MVIGFVPLPELVKESSMSVRVRLRQGDLFDELSDLIVLPCSTAPTISRFVEERLEDFRLKPPRTPMKLGDVRIRVFREAQHVAHYVAFAAAVGPARVGASSRLRAIERIAERLGRFTRRQNAVKVVTTALLGTGFGGIEPGAALLRLKSGFLANGADDTRLVVSVLDKIDYRDLGRRFKLSPAARKAAEADHACRVFISYSWSSPSHSRWVQNLAVDLQSANVLVRLDKMHYDDRGNVTQWMCNEIDLADLVLVICDAAYAKRADRRFGGVGWETRIMQADLQCKASFDRYIPIVRTNHLAEGCPRFLRHASAIHWPESANDNLIRKRLIQRIRKFTPEPMRRRRGIVVGYRERYSNP